MNDRRRHLVPAEKILSNNSDFCGYGKKKIFNDPVYGFVSVPYGILFDLVEHPFSNACAGSSR